MNDETETTTGPEIPGGTATYSPDDNKLRLSFPTRLSQSDYERVKAAGYRWAPKQEVFFTTWDPRAEDLAIQLCGEIEDDDRTLVERAEERAERFEGYKEKRRADAEAAHAAVERIADGIPMGQPILVGHHSERRARKDAERIQNGMAKAVRAWDTANYWKERAAGALAAAKYKEAPTVRSRRIKKLEADARKMEKRVKEHEFPLRFWRGELKTKDGEPFPPTHENALKFLGVSSCHLFFRFPLAKYPRNPPLSQYEGERGLWDALGGSEGPSAAIITPEQAAGLAIEAHEANVRWARRWLDHYNGRLEYERAMMQDSVGVSHLSDRWPHLAVGARITCRHWQLDWRTDVVFVVSKVNTGADGKPSSVSVAASSAVVPIEAILSCEPPEEGVAEKVKAASKLPPLCNYPSPGCVEMTSEEWKRASRYSDRYGTMLVQATETHGAHRRRCAWGRCEGGGYGKTPHFITDAKRTDPPPAAPVAPIPAEIRPRKVLSAAPPPPQAAAKPEDPDRAKFEALRAQAKAGVAVVVAPQLFPTPPELAARMVDEAQIEAGSVVLEPSAGTGNLLRAIRERAAGAIVHAVEINPGLVAQIRAAGLLDETAGDSLVCGDFLESDAPSPAPDRVVMNPPFAISSGGDIAHIRRAWGYLRPGGRLVALCAAGPRQRADLEPLAQENGGTFEILPDGQFAEQGTGVRVALLVIDKPAPAFGIPLDGQLAEQGAAPAPVKLERDTILPRAGEAPAPWVGQLALL